MRLLNKWESSCIAGGDVAPTCTVVTATITGSNGVSSTQVAVMCGCPANTTMSSTSVGGTTTVTCVDK